MSDLIEKLEVLFRDPGGLYPIAISREEHQQILSALRDQQTLRGIEGLYKLGQFVEIARPDGSDDGVAVSYQDEIGNMRQVASTTLPLAVEAAVAGMKQ